MGRPKVTTVLTLISIVIVLTVVALGSWERIAVRLAPAKTSATTRSGAALKADSIFWQTLHAGAYERIPNALEALARAYIDSPGDAITASHLGWLHIWSASEASRLDTSAATLPITSCYRGNTSRRPWRSTRTTHAQWDSSAGRWWPKVTSTAMSG